MKGYTYERMYRDARINASSRGHEILRLFVGCRLQAPGEQLKEVAAAARAHPQIGLLTDFAADRCGWRWGRRAGAGFRRPSAAADALRLPGGAHARHAVAAERALRRHGSKIRSGSSSSRGWGTWPSSCTCARPRSPHAGAAAGAGGGRHGLPARSPAAASRWKRSPCSASCACATCVPAQRLRFRAAREALNGSRDDLVRAVAQDVIAQRRTPPGRAAHGRAGARPPAHGRRTDAGARGAGRAADGDVRVDGGVADGMRSAKGIALRPRAPLPPAPSRSFLATAGDPSPNFGATSGEGLCVGAEAEGEGPARARRRGCRCRRCRCRCCRCVRERARRAENPEQGSTGSIVPPAGGLGAVGHGRIVPYGAPSPARSAAEGHATPRSPARLGTARHRTAAEPYAEEPRSSFETYLIGFIVLVVGW